MTAKLMFLQRQIKEQRNEISANVSDVASSPLTSFDVLLTQVDGKRDKDALLEQGGPRMEILQKRFGGGLLHSMSLARAPSTRHRDIPGLSIQAEGSGLIYPRKPALETFVPEPVHSGNIGDGVSNYGFHGVERVVAPVHKGAVQPAEWRTRLHAARRRVLLIVLVYVRWSSVLRRKRRMPRVNSFSYYIPAIFDEDLKRFVLSTFTATRHGPDYTPI